MQSRKPTTRTVAQRKVYGKRRNNAARAVFDQKSPAKEATSPPKEKDNTIEAIQSKLAEVTLSEEPALPQVDNPLLENKADEKSTASEFPSTDESSSPTATPQSLNTPTEQSPTEEPPAKPQRYETMVEVRICRRKVRPEPANTPEKNNTVSGKRRALRKKTPTARRSSGFVHDTKANTYVRSILNEALSSVASQSIQRFSTWASRSATMFHVAKLAEGSYGEVYKLHLREESCRPAVSLPKLAKLRAYGDGVFKVVPLRAQSGPGSKKFTSIEEIVSEVKMLKYLDPIPGFARFREIHVVQGRFPESFQRAWDHYQKTNDDSMNPNPSSKKAYPDSQLWAIVEMDDAGCELEKFCWSSIFQIYDIFWGVAMALARAEEYALFEVGLSRRRITVPRFLTLRSTGIFTWEMSASAPREQTAPWSRPQNSTSHASNPPVDLESARLRLPSSTTRSPARISASPTYPMILKASSRLLRPIWTESRSSTLLAEMRMRSC